MEKFVKHLFGNSVKPFIYAAGTFALNLVFMAILLMIGINHTNTGVSRVGFISVDMMYIGLIFIIPGELILASLFKSDKVQRLLTEIAILAMASVLFSTVGAKMRWEYNLPFYRMFGNALMSFCLIQVSMKVNEIAQFLRE